MPKLVCLLQFYNENIYRGVDGKTNLRRFMDSISQYCDALVAFNDGSTDDSRDLIMSYLHKGPLQEIAMPSNPMGKNAFKHELLHKAISLEHVRRMNGTHILWLDADEIIDRKGEQGDVRHYVDNWPKGLDGLNCFEINLWRTDRYYRVDELWAKGEFCRLWKMDDKLNYDVKIGLHHNLVPNGVDVRETCKTKVLHYGYASCDAVLRKYENYRAHGQAGWALNRMIDEAGLRLAEANPSWFVDKEWPHGPTVEVYNKRLVELLSEGNGNVFTQ